MNLHTVSTWLSDHPHAQAIAFWLMLGVITVVVKPRSAEEYARMASRRPTWLFSRVTALWVLIGSLGLDPLKTAAALSKLITGSFTPPPNPLADLRADKKEDSDA